jgi:hypothetical protein
VERIQSHVLTAATGSADELAQLLVAPEALGAVMNPHVAKAIATARGLLKNVAWPQDSIDELEISEARCKKLVADMAAVPQRARAWRFFLWKTPHAASAFPLSAADLELAGRSAGVY